MTETPLFEVSGGEFRNSYHASQMYNPSKTFILLTGCIRSQVSTWSFIINGLERMRNNVAFLIAIILLLVFNTQAFADIAPPEPAPGSGINPGQETKVRMVAENVLMAVKETSTAVYRIEVTADFAMRNLGEIDEHMQVRFPLENISGLGDGWADLPTEVRNFKARINKAQVPTKTIEQPYQSNGIPINWAVFDVNFPVNQDVYVHVSYETDVQNFDGPSSIEYILGTGEGWYESIGTATITLRFPYAVNINTFASHEVETGNKTG